MVLLSSSICEFGKSMPKFNLKNIDNNFFNIDGIRGKKGTLIFFICNHCPYVKAIIKKLVETTVELKSHGINSVGIMPNDFLKYPEDNFENMKRFAVQNNFIFPYLIDETQNVSKEFGAVCTPDFFGYNVDDELQYRGRLSKMNDLKFEDSSNDLFDAMKLIAQTKKGPINQFPSAGCSIKWKNNNI